MLFTAQYNLRIEQYGDRMYATCTISIHYNEIQKSRIDIYRQLISPPQMARASKLWPTKRKHTAHAGEQPTEPNDSMIDNSVWKPVWRGVTRIVNQVGPSSHPLSIHVWTN